MVVAKALTDAATQVSERRINTTLAHESGHCLLHAHLFALAKQSEGLFPKDDFIEPDVPKILCRDETSTYDGKWWEYQANASIGPLLLPRHLVAEVVHPLLEPTGLLGIKLLGNERRRDAERIVSNTFDVNPIAARIRLEQLFPNLTQKTL
jgi:hypothetical protein